MAFIREWGGQFVVPIPELSGAVTVAQRSAGARRPALTGQSRRTHPAPHPSGFFHTSHGAVPAE